MILSFEIIIVGISLILSSFLLAVTIRASVKGGPRAVMYLGAAFAVILLVNLLFAFSVFGIVFLGNDILPIFLLSDLILLIIFYFGAVRGI
ncbi:MAG: hypothetical protein ACYCT2_05065 [Thermoplasmataceae archaeon]